MWPFNLSVRLPIVDLVSRYLTNYLIGREPIFQRIAPLITVSCGTVILCGISICFQMLSPSERQVAHALLTRPPLSSKVIWPKPHSLRTPFDLHVLGTPPAFILSQDQTLMLKWCLCPASFIWHCLLLIRVASRSFSSICLFLNLAIHFSENLGIFRVALLFICQRS